MVKRTVLTAVFVLLCLSSLPAQTVGTQFLISARGEAAFQDSFFADRYGVPILYGLDASLFFPFPREPALMAILGNTAVVSIAADRGGEELWSAHLTVADRTLLGVGVKPGIDSPFTFMAAASLCLLSGIVFPDEEYFSEPTPSFTSQAGIGAYGGILFTLGSAVFRIGYSWYPDALIFGAASEEDRINGSSLDFSFGYQAGQTVEKLERKRNWEPLMRYYDALGDAEKTRHYRELFQEAMLAEAANAVEAGDVRQALGCYAKAALEGEGYRALAVMHASRSQIEVASGLFEFAGLSSDEARERALGIRDERLMTLWISADGSALGIHENRAVFGSAEEYETGAELMYSAELGGILTLSHMDRKVSLEEALPLTIADDAVIIGPAGTETRFTIVSMGDEDLVLEASAEGFPRMTYARYDGYRPLVALAADPEMGEDQARELLLSLAQKGILEPLLERYVAQGEVERAFDLVAEAKIGDSYRLSWYRWLLEHARESITPSVLVAILVRMSDIYALEAERCNEQARAAIAHGVELLRANAGAAAQERAVRNAEQLTAAARELANLRNSLLGEAHAVLDDIMAGRLPVSEDEVRRIREALGGAGR